MICRISSARQSDERGEGRGRGERGRMADDSELPWGLDAKKIAKVLLSVLCSLCDHMCEYIPACE